MNPLLPFSMTSEGYLEAIEYLKNGQFSEDLEGFEAFKSSVDGFSLTYYANKQLEKERGQ